MRDPQRQEFGLIANISAAGAETLRFGSRPSGIDQGAICCMACEVGNDTKSEFGACAVVGDHIGMVDICACCVSFSQHADIAVHGDEILLIPIVTLVLALSCEVCG
ncbi:unnamed protein product [Ostreobium quekettii]|uniref:Uncharacterized protein n=1 Tax=Ostreobium quekettii TaxID=121088 RepID=A0A8S1IRD5_9CHLO|nr:unnamed protein product [Ostreobium quekettii]